MKHLFLFYSCLLVFLLSFVVPNRAEAQVSILGAYPNTAVSKGGSVVVSPSSAQTGLSGLSAKTSPDFRGHLVADPVTGRVRVSNAYPAGVYSVTVTTYVGTVFPLPGLQRTFTLTVGEGAICTTGSLFSPTIEVANSRGADFSTVGDVNNDGKLDLLVCEQNASAVSIHLGDGTGRFTKFGSVPTGGSSIHIDVGDLNNDGKLDIVCTNLVQSTIAIRYGDGTGGFMGTTNLAVGEDPYKSIIRDINQDGKLDLLTACRSGQSVSVFLGSGLVNGFQAMPDVSIANDVLDIAADDINGDGKLDFVTANGDSHNVSIRLGDGAGGFTARPDISIDNNSFPGAISLGDMNGDGTPELVVAGLRNTTALFLNISKSNDPIFGTPGTAIFGNRINVSEDGGYVALADINNDGKADILTTRSIYDGGLRIYLGNGQFNFTPVDISGPHTDQLSLGDLNNDGYLDFVAQIPAIRTVTRYLGCQSPPAVNAPDLLLTPGTNTVMPIATVSQLGSTPSSLSLTVRSESALSDININGIANTNGTIRANVFVDCNAGSGRFALIVTDGLLVTESTLQVNVTPLSIRSQPASASTVTPGSTISTGVSVSATALLSYQWFRNHTPVSGQTSATLSLSNVQTTDAGAYRVVVSSPCNSVTSTPFNLYIPPFTVTPVPVSVSRNSTAQSVTLATINSTTGVSANLTVTINNSASATNNAITVSNLGKVNGAVTADIRTTCASSPATFVLTVSDGIQSTSVLVGVDLLPSPLPLITSEPASSSAVEAGATVLVRFEVRASDPVAYQWYRGGSSLRGQTEPTLTLSDVQASSAGTYYAVAITGCISLTSSTFSLSVNVPTVITITPADPLQLLVAEGGSVLNRMLATVSTTNGSPANLTVTINGSSSATLNGLSVTNLVNNNGTIQANLAATCGALSGLFTLMATDGIVSGSAQVRIGIAPTLQALAITSQPVAASSVRTGASVTAAVGAVSSNPITYQWYKDGQPVSGQTSAVLSLTSVRTGSSGVYNVVITSICQSVTSTPFTLQVEGPPIRLYVRANATGAGTGLNWQDAFTDLQSALTYANRAELTEIWVASGIYKPSGGGTDRSLSFIMLPNVAIYGGFVGTETQLSARPTVSITAPSGTTLSGDIGLVGNADDNSYHVIKTPTGSIAPALLDGFVITGGNANGNETNLFDRGGGLYNASMNLTIRNCGFVGNVAREQGGGICTEGGSLAVQNSWFSSNNGGLNGGGVYGGGNAQFVNCSFFDNRAADNGGAFFNAGQLNVSFLNCSFLRNVSFDGGALTNGMGSVQLTNCIVWNNGGIFTFSGGNIMATYSLFDIAESGSGYSGSNNLVSSVSPFVSATSTQITGCSPAVNAGNPVTTTVTASSLDLAGNARLSGGRIDIGAFEFQGEPQQSVLITSQPTAGTVVSLGSVVLAGVNVSGTGPYAYQWYRNGQAVAGQTSAILSLTNVQLTDGGNYRAVVSTACNSVTSTVFSLSVVVTRLYVRANATGANTGLSWQDAYTDLQSALTNSQINAAEIWVAGGVYKPTTGTNRNTSFVVKPGTRLFGGFLGTETERSQRPAINVAVPSSSTLSGDIGTLGTLSDNSYHVVVGQAGLSPADGLDGFVIMGGNANGNVASVSGNGLGGGLYLQGIGSGQFCSPTIRNCLFANNQANNGGAVCTDASNGGNTSPIFERCTFSGNGAQFWGGAVSNYAPQNGTGNPRFLNCSFINNGAVSKGGAVYSALYTVNSRVTLLNCSIQSGGTLYNEEGAGRMVLTNCLLWDTFGRAVIQSAVTANYCLFRATETNYTGVGNVLASYSPFESTTSTKLAIACSPAVDAGDPETTVGTAGTADGFDNLRIVGGRVDIGAYELQSTPPVVSRIYVNASATGANTGLTWADALTDLQMALSYPCKQLREIWVAAGSYRPAPQTSFSMRPEVAIYGGFVGTETELSQRPAINLTIPSSTSLLGNGRPIVSNGPGLTEAAVLDGFVLANNTSLVDGGGLVNDGSGAGNSCSTLIQKCWFVNNSAVRGGGIYSNGSNGGRSGALIRECVFVNNFASEGGAICTDNRDLAGRLVIENSIFRNNKGQFQGGAVWGDGTVEISNCLFEAHSNPNCYGTMYSRGMVSIDNSTFRHADGLYSGLYFEGDFIQINNSEFSDQIASQESSLITSGRVTNCRFLRNRSFAPLLTTGTVTIDKCLFEDNQCSLAGAIKGAANLTVSNSTFVRNSSGRLAGVFDAGTFWGGGERKFLFTNCVFAHNRGGPSGKLFSGRESTGEFVNCSFYDNYTEVVSGPEARFSAKITNCVFGNNRGQNLFSNADLTANYSVLEQGEMASIAGANNIIVTTSPFATTNSAELSACSPAINAGDPATTTAIVGVTDLAGNSRFVGARIDMGALEFQGGVLQPLAITTQPVVGTVVQPGSVVTTVIGVMGTGLIAVQWYKDGQPVSGQASAMLSLTNVQRADAGNYFAVVTDGCTSLTSNSFNLDVAGLSNFTVCSGQTVSLTASGGESYTLLNTGLINTTGIFVVLPTGTTTYTVLVSTPTGTQLTLTSLVTMLEQHPDYAPLADLYQATNGIAWLNRTGWLESCNPCSGWYGVSCQNGRVVSLSLSANGLVGLLPASLPVLNQLQYLDLSNNLLQGCFPASLTALCTLPTKNFAGNTGLPGGGDFGAFCERGVGSDALLVSLVASRDRVCAGDGVVLEARVQGTGPFTYQWYSGAVLLSGETGPRLELGNLRQSTNYRVVVVGSCPTGVN